MHCVCQFRLTASSKAHDDPYIRQFFLTNKDYYMHPFRFGEIYQFESSWYGQVVQVSRKEIKHSTATTLYAPLPTDDCEVDVDEFFLRVKWLALVGDPISAILSAESMLPESSPHLRGIRELIPTQFQYIVRESMIDYSICLYSYDVLHSFPYLAVEGSLWMFYIVGDTATTRGLLSSQNPDTLAFGAGMLTIRNAIREKIAGTGGSKVSGFYVSGHGITPETMNMFQGLFPQQIRKTPSRSSQIKAATSNNPGSTAGIKMMKYTLTYDTWVISFAGDEQMGYLTSVLGDDFNWNPKLRTWRAVRSSTDDSIPENETVFVLKDTPSRKTSISFECRVPSDGTSLLGVTLYVKMEGSQIVIPNDKSAREVKEFLKP